MKTFLTFVLAMAALASGCEVTQQDPGSGGSQQAGPIDGTYAFTSWKCGSTDVLAYLISSQGLTGATVTVAGNTASIALAVTGGCTITAKFSVTYPAGGVFVNVDQGVACSSSCSGAQCTARGARVPTRTDTFNYGASAGTLTSTRMLAASDVAEDTILLGAGCAAGQVEAAVLTKK